jgi:hypothetical protein
VGADLKVHIAAPAAIAAIRAAAGHIFFTAEGRQTIATITSFNVYIDAINKI